MKFSDVIFWILVVVAVVAWLPPSGVDREAQAEHRQQCDMWGIWHADRRAGVPVNKRFGWPDQAGRYYEECKQ